jgi:hypothetical protein
MMERTDKRNSFAPFDIVSCTERMNKCRLYNILISAHPEKCISFDQLRADERPLSYKFVSSLSTALLHSQCREQTMDGNRSRILRQLNAHRSLMAQSVQISSSSSYPLQTNRLSRYSSSSKWSMRKNRNILFV